MQVRNGTGGMPRILKLGEALPPRLRRHVLATIAVGVPVVAAAAAVSARSVPSLRTIAGVATFFCLTVLAEWRPVPIDTEGDRLVSLAFVFIVASEILFGWQWAVPVGALGIGLVMALERVEPLKAIFNGAAYAIAAGLAAVPLLLEDDRRQSYALLALTVVASGAIFVLVNVALVCAAIALAAGTRVREVFADHLRYSGPIFAIAVLVAAQAVILWRVSAPLVLLLSAPLFALTLYQRSSVRGRVAEKAASTDSLTCLKNRRAFEEDAARRLDVGAVTLCLIDVDRFKQVNDRYGHPTGDAVLARLACALEETAPGRGYRLGGDEFALLLEPSEHGDALAEVQRRFAAAQARLAELAEPVTISAGVASSAGRADDLHALHKRADMALYRSKYNGRAKVSVCGGADALGDDPASAGGALGRLLGAGGLGTAGRLAALVDAVVDASARERGLIPATGLSDALDRWSVSNGDHSRAVASLAVALARRLGVVGEELAHVELAALLHDVGKVAVPDRVLSKPGPLTDEERALVERHPVVGYELLRDLGIAGAATFVLHHHERWDGTGYPHRLAGAEIPFGARIVLVADAFDALTSDRAHRPAVSVEAAIDEVRSESGRQFDPLVASALHEHFAHPERGLAGAAGGQVVRFPREEGAAPRGSNLLRPCAGGRSPGSRSRL